MRRVDRKPRIAMVSPWPPLASGVGDYASKLANELRRDYEIDAYHDPALAADFPGLGDGITHIPAPLLPRLAGLRNYRSIIYQMGNSRHHSFLYKLMPTHPGIVTLHDLRLTNFHESYGELPEVGRDHLVREIAYDRPRESADLLRSLPAMRQERGGIPVALASRGIDLNRRVFDCANAVIVHSKWGRDRAVSMYPEHTSRIHRVPFGAMSEEVSAEAKSLARRRLGLADDSIVIASLGFLGWGKMNEEAVEAFAAISHEEPRAILVFAGRDLDEGHAAKRAQNLGVSDRVRFLEGTTDADLCDLARASDLGVNLRRTPTNGETSGTLFTFLRMGVPTIVTEIDSFQDEPENTVVRIRWQRDGMPGLISALRSLIMNRDEREKVGRSAFELVNREHSWAHVASKYREWIEQSRPARQRVGA